MAFEPIKTQEELDSIINDRIGRAKDSVRKEFEGWRSPDAVSEKTSGLEKKIGDLTASLNSANDKVAEIQKTVAERDKTIKGYETASVKTRIAHEAGLSYEAINFLQGEDEDAIKRSAEALKGLVGSGNPSPLGDSEPQGGDEGKGKAAYKKLLKGLKGE